MWTHTLIEGPRAFLVALFVSVGVVVGASLPASAAPEKDRYAQVRESLDSEGYFELDEDGVPKRREIALGMVYEMGHKRPVGRGKEKMNLYLTGGSVAVPHKPSEVLELLTAFDGYKDWGLHDLNNLKLHPRGAKSWNFELEGITSTTKFPGIQFDVTVFKFGQGTIDLKEIERDDQSDKAPSVLHLELADKRNLFVKRFTLTFFIFPLEGGKGSAIRFENELALRSALDWFFRGREENPVEVTKPRVEQFLKNVVSELDRRAAAREEERKASAPAPGKAPEAAKKSVGSF
ncbi:MAG: hypothetical protein ACYS22_15430 [Planctomycetota bacterium]|jgi:hypothetical protein